MLIPLRTVGMQKQKFKSVCFKDAIIFWNHMPSLFSNTWIGKHVQYQLNKFLQKSIFILNLNQGSINKCRPWLRKLKCLFWNEQSEELAYVGCNLDSLIAAVW